MPTHRVSQLRGRGGETVVLPQGVAGTGDLRARVLADLPLV
jgi:hypothetical protein